MEMVSQIGKCFRVQWGLQEGQTQIKKNRRLVVEADFLSYNMLNEEPFCVAVCQFLQGICLRFAMNSFLGSALMAFTCLILQGSDQK